MDWGRIIFWIVVIVGGLGYVVHYNQTASEKREAELQKQAESEVASVLHKKNTEAFLMTLQDKHHAQRFDAESWSSMKHEYTLSLQKKLVKDPPVPVLFVGTIIDVASTSNDELSIHFRVGPRSRFGSMGIRMNPDLDILVSCNEAKLKKIDLDLSDSDEHGSEYDQVALVASLTSVRRPTSPVESTRGSESNPSMAYLEPRRHFIVSGECIDLERLPD